MYITKTHNKGKKITPDEINKYLQQFEEPYRAMIIGYLNFTSNLYHYAKKNIEAVKGNDEQENVSVRAGTLIGHQIEKMLDQLTDLYANASGEGQNRDTEHAFIEGYKNGLSYYREATYNNLKKGAFKGKERDIAMSFYTSVGLDLAERLEALMAGKGDQNEDHHDSEKRA